MNKLVASVLLLSPLFCSAGVAGAGNIVGPYGLFFMQTGALLVSTDAVQSGAPACATVVGRWAIDGTTPAGKLQAAAVIAALAMGKKIAIWGTGTCSVWGDTETVSFLQVVN